MHSFFWLAMVCGVLLEAPLAEAQTLRPLDLISGEQTPLRIHAKKKPLKILLRDIESQLGIEISGLDDRAEEIVNISITGLDQEDLMKAFLRSLNEKNAAFEYQGHKLFRILVVPTSQKIVRNRSEHKSGHQIGKAKSDEVLTVVEVHGIVSGSQAESLGIREHDLILEYDNKPITSTHQLINAVKKKNEWQTVEMVILSEELIIRHTLNGGLIGVRIRTKQIKKSLLASYFNGTSAVAPP